MQTMTLEWIAEQVCGECGEGVFIRHGALVECTECQHIHPMDPINLGEGERFEWHHTTQARGDQTLHVASYFTA